MVLRIFKSPVLVEKSRTIGAKDKIKRKSKGKAVVDRTGKEVILILGNKIKGKVHYGAGYGLPAANRKFEGRIVKLPNETNSKFKYFDQNSVGGKDEIVIETHKPSYDKDGKDLWKYVSAKPEEITFF